MRHRAKGRQLCRTSSHRRALLNNMATSLFEHGRVITTEAKAKELRPFAEKLITLARRGDLHARRLVERKIKDRETLSPPLQRDRPAVRRAARRLHPDPQARPPRRRRRGHRPDRAALRVTGASAAARNKKGDPRVPFFRRTLARGARRRRSRLGRLGDPVTLQALRAHPDALGRALDQHPHRLQIRIPAALGSIVGVADVVAGDRPLAAHGAHPCHSSIL